MPNGTKNINMITLFEQSMDMDQPELFSNFPRHKVVGWIGEKDWEKSYAKRYFKEYNVKLDNNDRSSVYIDIYTMLDEFVVNINYDYLTEFNVKNVSIATNPLRDDTLPLIYRQLMGNDYVDLPEDLIMDIMRSIVRKKSALRA